MFETRPAQASSLQDRVVGGDSDTVRNTAKETVAASWGTEGNLPFSDQVNTHDPCSDSSCAK